MYNVFFPVNYINVFCMSVQDSHVPVTSGAKSEADESTPVIDSLVPQNAVNTAVNGY